MQDLYRRTSRPGRTGISSASASTPELGGRFSRNLSLAGIGSMACAAAHAFFRRPNAGRSRSLGLAQFVAACLLVAPSVAIGDAITLSPSQSVYLVGQPVELDLLADLTGSTAAESVQVGVRYSNPALVDGFAATASQQPLTSFAGLLTWTLGSTTCHDSGCLVILQVAGTGVPINPDPLSMVAVGHLELPTLAVGTLTITVDTLLNPFSFFGAPLPAPVQIEIVDDCAAADGLVAHWALDGDGLDSTPCLNDGSVTGAVSAAGFDGTPGGALSFSNPGDRVDVDYDFTLQPAIPMTLSVWVRHDCPLNDFCPIFDNDTHPTNYSGISLQLIPGGQIEANYGDGGAPGSTSRRSTFSDSAIPADEWHHVVVVMHDLVTTEIYIDGIPDSTTTSGSGGPLAYYQEDAVIGNVPSGLAPFPGELDELKLFRRALTPAEVIELPEPGAAPSLLAGACLLLAMHRRRGRPGSARTGFGSRR